MPHNNQELLEMALIGLEAQRAKIEGAMAEIRAELHGHVGRSAALVAERAPKPRRKMSAAAKRRIVAAQKKRRAEWHAAKG